MINFLPVLQNLLVLVNKQIPVASENGVLHRSWVEGLMVRASTGMNFLKLISIYLVVDQLVLHISHIIVLIIKDPILLVFLVNFILVFRVVDDVVSVQRVIGEIDDLFASYYRFSVEANLRHRLLIQRVIQLSIDLLSYRLVNLRMTAVKLDSIVLGMTVFRVLLDCRVFILLAFHRSWLLN
jgi:hypothetical protein